MEAPRAPAASPATVFIASQPGPLNVTRRLSPESWPIRLPAGGSNLERSAVSGGSSTTVVSSVRLTRWPSNVSS